MLPGVSGNPAGETGHRGNDEGCWKDSIRITGIPIFKLVILLFTCAEFANTVFLGCFFYWYLNCVFQFTFFYNCRVTVTVKSPLLWHQ